MSLPIGTALKDGFAKTASRAGAILIAAYLVVNGVYLVSVMSTIRAYAAQNGAPMTGATGLALDLPLSVAGALLALSGVLLLYLPIVTIRTFVADERQSVRSEHLTGGVLFALLNLVVGGIVYGIAVFIGLVLLVVPGVFLMVALAFMQVFIVVEGDNFVAAMRKSWRLTEGDRFALFALGAVIVGLSFALWIVLTIGSFVVAFAGISQAVLSVAQLVITIPVSLYTLAVLASAFNLLRGDAGDLDGGESTTTPDTPSTPA
ncbi:hypothetical protein SAMN05216559_2012 [Halomicrobium zhouii]|uniref:DUF7847 domain-containing protein n=1 Tax=Halomicrobium zhouii TaxID=767519 RepID=A0A1I6L4D6_9EURY|nr:hypothetical protein [Halomicrobium zhouii]SFR98319.1 hypothetical protein SAMN05216559_2012 [Halomicrobium zhouii]